MPGYIFTEKETGDIVRQTLAEEDLQQFLDSQPQLELGIMTSGYGIVDSIRLGHTKPDNAFRDILGNIKKRAGRHKSVNVNTF